MKAYWTQLNDREQVSVGIAGLCCVLYLFYALLFSPLVTAVVMAEQDWTDKKTTLVWMQQVAQGYSRGQAPKQVTSGNLLSVLTELLSKASFQRFPYQLEQTSNGDIQLTFAKVPYNGFIAWLDMQSKHYTLSIKTLYLNKTELPGVVKATVVFTVGA